ncbi:Hypothetical protein GLP15_2376 [Giardia lamblia P15]|uniref:RING-type domain-containing protein n=1 Tax=Giardia intestinalis (strain P15) TaxID=658858 RepID=E1F502_GIAIA|nr:Hypothetical protein GLP15_2376 [Giardia lamblia P15]
MPPRQPKLPSQEKKTSRNISMPTSTNAAESGTEKKDYKLKGPPAHLPKIGSPTVDTHLARLPSPLPSPSVSPTVPLVPYLAGLERDPDISRLATPTACSEDFLQATDKHAITLESPDSCTTPLNLNIRSDDEPPGHNSPKPLSSSFVGRKYKQSVEKYKNSKLNAPVPNLHLADLPPTHPDHRNPKDYLERLRTPSPVLLTPSPLSHTVTRDNTPTVSKQDQLEERLLTPIESPTDSFIVSPQLSGSQQLQLNNTARSHLPHDNKVTEDFVLERLATPEPVSHEKAQSLNEGFHFPNCDEDSSVTTFKMDASFVSRLETPGGMSFSRPFSRLNNNIPFYVPDAENYPENGIPDIADYDDNLISLNDCPQDYSAIVPAPVRPADASYSAPSSIVHDSLEGNAFAYNKFQPGKHPIQFVDNLPIGNLSSSLNAGQVTIDVDYAVDDKKVTTNATNKHIYPMDRDAEAFSEKFDLLVPESKQHNQSIYKHTTFHISRTNICKVCRYPLYKPVVLTCGHTFCAECMYYSLLLWENKCPICDCPVSHLPHVDETISEQLASQLGFQVHLNVGDIVRVLAPSGKIATYSCGIITSIQSGFSFESADGIHVRSTQMSNMMTKQVQQNNKCSGTPCKIATVQCGSSIWLGRLCDLLFVDPQMLPLGTRLNARSLCIFSSSAINLINTLSTEPSLDSSKDDKEEQIFSASGPINYTEPRFLHTFKYMLSNLSEEASIYMLLEESFGSDKTVLLSTALERIEGPPTSSLLRLCTDLSEWLLMPEICCVNCKMVAQLPVRLHCGCLSCMICAFDCYHHSWPCFGCGAPVIFLDLSLSGLRANPQTSVQYNLLLKDSKPVGVIPMDSKILAAISDVKAGDPYLSKYFPVHVLQDSGTDSSFGLLLTEPSEKTAKIMLKSGTVLTVDVNRIRHIPLDSVRLALRVQTPLTATFNLRKEVSGPAQLPLLGLTDMAVPRQFVTRFGRHKSTTADDRSIASLSIFTMVYNTDSFLHQMRILVDEINAHNKELRRARLHAKYKAEYIARAGNEEPANLKEEGQRSDLPIPTTNLQEAMALSQNEYFNEQFNDLTKRQVEIERELRPFGVLECSRLSNYIKLLSSFTISEFICTACTRIAVRPVRLPCNHLTCKTCAAIYYVSQIPCLICGRLLESIADIKPDLRTFQKICSHIPGKLHAEQVDCGTYVCKPANRNIGVGIVLNTMSRGGIIFATVGFVRSIGTFRLAELAVLLPVMEVCQVHEVKGCDTPVLIENPSEAIGQACIVVVDGPYKDIFGLIVRKNGPKGKVILTVVLEVGVVVPFSPADLRIIKLMGPLCNYSKFRMYAQIAEKSFIAQERYMFSAEVEAAVQKELNITTSLCLAGKVPPPPRTIYSCLPRMSVVSTKRFSSRSNHSRP